MVFVPHELPFQVVATGAMQGAGCADAGGGGGGNDDNMTPEKIQKIIKAMNEVTGCQAQAADGTSVEPASKKAKLRHPESGMEGLQVALNSWIEAQDRVRAMEHETAVRSASGAGGAATALAGDGGAATALAETPQVALDCSIGAAPIPTVQDGGSAASSAPAANVTAVP